MRNDPKIATDADIDKVMIRGREHRIIVVGADVVLATVLAAGHNRKHPLHTQSDWRPFRLAFGIYDRIRTGELPTWPCTLCNTTHSRLTDLSVLSVVDHPDDTAKDPALVALVCHACDEDDTPQRLHAYFGLEI